MGATTVCADPGGGILWTLFRGEWEPRLQNIGGRWWRCLSCGGSIAADCECCEPPSCHCHGALHR